MGVWCEVRWLSQNAVEKCRESPEIASAFVGSSLDFDRKQKSVSLSRAAQMIGLTSGRDLE